MRVPASPSKRYHCASAREWVAMGAGELRSHLTYQSLGVPDDWYEFHELYTFCVER